MSLRALTAKASFALPKALSNISGMTMHLPRGRRKLDDSDHVHYSKTKREKP